MRLTARALGFLALALALSRGEARADMIIGLQQVGADVVMTGNGTINLAGLSAFISGPLAARLEPDSYFISGAPGKADTYVDLGGFSGPTNFGPGTATTAATSGTGDLFGLQFVGFTGIAVPTGYVSGGALSGSATYVGETFGSLGVTPGTYEWTLSNGDTVTLNVAPEPSSLTLLGLGVAGLLGLRWRRRVA